MAALIIHHATMIQRTVNDAAARIRRNQFDIVVIHIARKAFGFIRKITIMCGVPSHRRMAILQVARDVMMGNPCHYPLTRIQRQIKYGFATFLAKGFY